jgi:hypothetical protein
MADPSMSRTFALTGLRRTRQQRPAGRASDGPARRASDGPAGRASDGPATHPA